ncbi:helix-turn-helix transcriptional regulator [Paenibacillus sp. F411]|uniref:helix-turn-helix domain-containing protein n=1 Tax=Paenibacillus sp. F411 TaxID=2820239 RepID=UPI001AAF5567|nr:helix-turn-helix transcriptional regulator [Paenibacillus sp. F411]
MTTTSKPFRHSYGFRFRDIPSYSVSMIRGVGWENIMSTDYNWNGLTREDTSMVLFQYTVSGSGQIRIGDQLYSLNAGNGFLVSVPSDHHYYFPQGSSHWEFLYITLTGNILPIYEEITSNLDPIFSLSAESSTVQLLRNIFEMAHRKQIMDGYVSSSLAYQFLTELSRISIYPQALQHFPRGIQKVLDYMELHYESAVSLEEFANIAEMSKYHFLREFRRCKGITPIEYLIKLRIEKAAHLIRTTEISLKDISRAVGFANGNYFSKVFRSWVGVSPGQFRRDHSLIASDHLFFR